MFVGPQMELVHVNLVSRILRWLLDLGKFVAGCSMVAKIQTSLYENCFSSVCKKCCSDFVLIRELHRSQVTVAFCFSLTISL
jgi:hypothetical protein